MSYLPIDIEDMVSFSAQTPIIDVRSPAEYAHARIPGAINLPLFTDEERAVVGTAYKQESREVAIKLGLDYFGPKMRKMVEDVESICKKHHLEKTIIIHCWRGGMRSGAVAWLLDLYGFKVYVINGGYKAFRKWGLEQFGKINDIKVIGGYTGSGKTFLLHELEKQGEVVINLEGLASHKGSAFGNIGLPDQPSQEMFENMLAIELYQKTTFKKPIWVEDESQRIGAINVPNGFYQKMSTAPSFFLEIPFEERLDFIVQEYGVHDKQKLIDTILRIQKRLGGLETKNAVNYMNEDNIRESFRILLKYYDRFYLKSLKKKNDLYRQVTYIQCERVGAKEIVGKLMDITL